MVLITIHDEAKASFDREAEAVVALARPGPLRLPRLKPVVGSMAERHVVDLPQSAVLRPPQNAISSDPAGTLSLIELFVDGTTFVLEADACLQLQRFLRKMAARPELRSHCGPEFLRSAFLEWAHLRLAGSTQGFWSVALANLQRDVSEREVMIPLEGLHIAHAFPLGDATLDYFRKSDFERHFARIVRETTKDTERETDRLRTRYQGRVVVRVKVEAESDHAYEVALSKAREIVLVLRAYHPAARFVELPCYFGVLGELPPAEAHAFFEVAGRPESRIHGAVPGRFLEVTWSELDLRQLREHGGLAEFDRLLKTDRDRTEYERKVLEAARLLGRGVGSLAWQDRLLHALVAAETLLLRNQSEPIQRSLGQRLAMLVEQTVDARLALVRDLEQAYRLRSRFVHHGETVAPEDLDAINRVLRACQKLIVFAAFQKAFPTKDALLDDVDRMMLS